MDVLVQELLDRFPVPEDLEEILAEPDVEVHTAMARALECKSADVIHGFHPSSVVEQVRVPRALHYIVEVKTISEEYNVARGNIATYTVDVSDWVELKRLPDEKASFGTHAVAVFQFEYLGCTYLLRYDPGSDVAVAKLFISLAEASGNQSASFDS